MSGWMTTAVTLGLMVSITGAVRTEAPKVGDTAKDFTLKTIEGRPVTLSELTKEGPVALIVLRGWPGYQCPLCTRQVKDLAAHAKEFAGAKAKVVLVYPGPTDQLGDHASEFLGKSTLPEGFTFVTDPDYVFTNLYGLRWDKTGETAYPSTFVIDGDNTIKFAKVSRTHGDRADTKAILGALANAK